MCKKNQKCLIFAHRGANNIAPENTIKAFREAIRLKADYIEFDLFKSKDGELVITHDPNLFRLTGYNGLVEELTLEELRTLDFGEGEKIPLLQDLIKLAKDNIGLCIEIISKGIGEKLISLLKFLDVIESTIISSFNFKELRQIQKLEPRIKIAWLIPYDVIAENNPKWIRWKTKKNAIDKAAKNNFSNIHAHYAIVDKQLIDYCHQQNLKVIVYVVDVKPAMKRLIRNGIDGIMTDNLNAAKEVLERMK